MRMSKPSSIVFKPLKGRLLLIKQKQFLTLITVLGCLAIVACSNNSPQATTTASSPGASPPTESQSPTSTTAKMEKTSTNSPSHGGQGGQIIESGPYHLELVTVHETDGTHLDFFLQKGDAHDPIPNAKVTAQVQLPDGSQQALAMKYDTAGKHYYAELASTATGEYKVAVLSDIQGEKVNARYIFKK